MTFGDRLKELRLQAGMTQEGLATASGVSLGAIREYEQKDKEPILRTAFRLADGLGVKIGDFRTEEAPSEARPKKTARKPKGKAK